MEIQTLPYRWGIEKVSKNANAAFFMQSNWRTLSLSLAEGKEREKSKQEKSKRTLFTHSINIPTPNTHYNRARGKERERERERKGPSIYSEEKQNPRESPKRLNKDKLSDSLGKTSTGIYGGRQGTRAARLD